MKLNKEVKKMSKNSFLETKNYRSIMFLLLIITSLILLFNFIDFVESIDKKITAYAINDNLTDLETEQLAEQTQTNQIPDQSEIDPETESEQGKVYTTSAWSIFYIILIIIIILAAVLFITLKNTIEENIVEEEKQKGVI